MNRILKLFLIFTAILLIAFQTENSHEAHSRIGTEATLKYYRTHAKAFYETTQRLEKQISKLSADTVSRNQALAQLASCRIAYKKIDFFTSYFFKNETRMINAAPVVEVEEPTLEYIEAMGLQAIESLLADESFFDHKSELLLQTGLLNSTASQLTALLYNFELTDSQILESLKVDLIRVMTLSISGYDAPELKTGVLEAAVSLETLETILRPYLEAQSDQISSELAQQLTSTLSFIRQNPDFNSFDRIQFLRQYALPLQAMLTEAIRCWQLEIHSQKYLNYERPHLFSTNAIRIQSALPSGKVLDERIKLGKKLFSNTSLSGNGKVSCATCHQPNNYFNDNLKKSAAIHLDSILKRNTPTLLYAGFQHNQFWDGRSASLEAQIEEVIFNPLEMDGKISRISQELLADSLYQVAFAQAFPELPHGKAGLSEIGMALAAFITNLQPHSSRFDRYMNGDSGALTEREKNGFNIFMGKGQCGTCHFSPYFNGLLPPHFDVTEVEILGSPAHADLENPIIDSDRGRYDLYKVKYYDGAFKTPTVRNASKTAPYMHNGAFNTLMEVVEFYDRGGGAGLGLNIPNQTLSAQPLNLTATEKEDICLFIESLTDNN
ncbi:cytochrome-c peroxidase [Dyadobacter tibetensis]|uniref:cytochrome-c peroxidase n=1 Tax=Dyadobacter tibetensis TaxID=1211851 RepID=UPI00046F95F0|nr:cytochrome c peroxidase [Dyadobacter tibetensis]